jgi:hypothetical protein
LTPKSRDVDAKRVDRGFEHVSDPSFGQLLQRCRQNFGSAPRQLAPGAQAEFRLRPSLIMRMFLVLTRDPLRNFLRDQDLLRDYGRVVWGHLVQANNALYEPSNRAVRPAVLLYSPDSYFDNRVELLGDLASELYDLKGNNAGDPELDRFVAAITDEMARAPRLLLPNSLCDGKEAFFATFLVQPSHLPVGYLAKGMFPVVICPERTEAVMILPAPYWPKELCDWWAT